MTENKKINNLDFISVSTSSGNSLQSRNEETVIQTQKATGDIKPQSDESGFAKASPNFKKLETPKHPETKEDEKKVIAQNTINKKTNEDENEEDSLPKSEDLD